MGAIVYLYHRRDRETRIEITIEQKKRTRRNAHMAEDKNIEHKTVEDTQKESQNTCESLEVYTMPTCGHCKRLKNWLTSEGVPHTDYNIMEDKQAHLKFSREYQMNKVPFVVCGDKRWTGFREEYKDEFKAAVK